MTPLAIEAGLGRLLRIPFGRGGLSAPRPAGRLLGLVEGVVDGRLAGWAFDPASPHERVTVTVVIDGVRRTVLADRYRADLHGAGVGDGHAGFSVPLPPTAARAVVVAGPDGDPLPGSPASLLPRPPGRARRVGPIVFGLDPPHLSGRRVEGWAVDARDARRPLRLGLANREGLLSETRASRYRADRAALGADAFCGFSLDHPGGRGPLRLVHLPAGTRLAALR